MDSTTYIASQGISFPFILTNGAINVDSINTLIAQSIKTVVSWSFGRRPFNPKFGSRSEEILGDPTDGVTIALVRFFIADAISTWEKRISLLEVTIGMPEAYKIELKLVYRIKSTREIQELNFQYQL